MGLLETKRLYCGYGTKTILYDINFTVKPGEFIGIIGPNGSGKTTLLRALSRLIHPKKGCVLFKGKNLWSINQLELAQEVAVVSQSLPPEHMTVEEFVLLGRIPFRKSFQFQETKHDTDIAAKAMDLTGVIKLREQFLGQISAGERQLTVIARALAQEPKLFLLDEPNTHLDITHQVQVMDLLKKLNKTTSITILIILHDLNLASEYCNRLILINNGRIHKDGQPNDVLDYRIIEEVYKTVVLVEKNPVSSKPYMLLVSEEERERRQK